MGHWEAETMDEEEHEVYGGEIPDESAMDADVDLDHPDDEAAKVPSLSYFRFPLRFLETLTLIP